ncbi:TonB-dependent siderophore receptor [uncultured Aquabacterium sp.]|uniref:TonB-dependent receptor plug domain-containing protein n=1 Tax=Aquabacterium sp. TaxID=1872578 RepID=UPI0025D527DB|nr:TonB-dependent receptor [uncultured Aquabacterium sp.]
MLGVRANYKVWGVLCALGCVAGSSARALERVPTEEDYYANIPVVLTASRLDQPLNEAPGAITVVDRNTIRLSGARTIAEVLRLVPGYLSSGWNGANPLSAYHVPLDDYGIRNLVLIDGRSVYSTAHLGDTHRGMMDVMLEDIERIEVLRGANSAAYGANAMFGVINIITRHSADTVGGELGLTVGNDGIFDKRARVGGGNEVASFRLSAGEQRDSGYRNAYDDKRLSQLNGRVDLRPSAVDEVMLASGVSYLAAGEGYTPTDDGNPYHTIYSRDVYLQLDWRHQLADSDEFKLSASFMEDRKQDYALSPNRKLNSNPPVSGESVIWDYGALGRRSNIEAQRRFGLGNGVRALVGLGFKDERAKSEALYHNAAWQSFQESRAFGTVEWRMTPQWLFNAGLFVGKHSLAGTYATPRLMANWLLAPGHTLRFGATESVRAPNLSEYVADVRHYTTTGALYQHEYAATGRVQPEKLRSVELGYVGRLQDYRLTFDVRLFREQLDEFIVARLPSTRHPETGKRARDYLNYTDLLVTGGEYQVRWKPAADTELWLNQTFTETKWDNVNYQVSDERRPPRHHTTIAWFQRLSPQTELSVIHERLGGMTWRYDRDWLPFSHRTDVRLAQAFRLGDSKAEAALTVQSLEGQQDAFLISRGFALARRVFVTLKLEI